MIKDFVPHPIWIHYYSNVFPAKENPNCWKWTGIGRTHKYNQGNRRHHPVASNSLVQKFNGVDVIGNGVQFGSPLDVFEPSFFLNLNQQLKERRLLVFGL